LLDAASSFEGAERLDVRESGYSRMDLPRNRGGMHYEE
jgi:hypothetical protein